MRCGSVTVVFLDLPFCQLMTWGGRRVFPIPKTLHGSRIVGQFVCPSQATYSPILHISIMSPWLKSQKYSKIGEESTDEKAEIAAPWLRRNWHRGKLHVLYAALLIIVAFVSRKSSSPQLQSNYYGDEPIKSELRRKTEVLCSRWL